MYKAELMNIEEKLSNGEALSQEEVDIYFESRGINVDKITEALKNVAYAVGEYMSAVIPLLSALNQMAYEVNQTLEKCPNYRVVHLAKHAKKLRHRQKNYKRAYRIVYGGRG